MKKNISILLIGIGLIAGFALSGCGRQGPDDNTPPTVTATSPENGTWEVPINISMITITFSEEIDPSTINDQTISLMSTSMSGTGVVSGSLSCDGKNVVFTPAGPLSPNTPYTLTIGTGVKDFSGNAMEKAYVCLFFTGMTFDMISPTVSSTIPAAGAQNVEVTSPISVTFNEQMLVTSITGTTIRVSDGTRPIAGTITYSGTTAVFTGSLTYETTYTVTVSKNVKDLAGNPMTSDYIWSFTTGATPDTTPPSVKATIPGMEATNVDVSSLLKITFDEPVNQSSVIFTLTGGGATIPCAVNYNMGTMTASITPSNSLAYNTLYTATIRAGLTDLSGNAMAADYMWSFITGTAPDTTPPKVATTIPEANATNIEVTSPISVTFNELMLLSSITGTTFTVSDGTGQIAGAITYSGGTTAVFTGSLAYGTMYTVTVSKKVKDLAGNQMKSDYSWSFTTAAEPDTTPPAVSATSPGSGAIDVDVTTPIIITFSEPMKNESIKEGMIALSDGISPVTGVITFSDSVTAVFTPSSPLAFSTSYTVVVKAGIEDSAGNAMTADYAWSFTTAGE